MHDGACRTPTSSEPWFFRAATWTPSSAMTCPSTLPRSPRLASAVAASRWMLGAAPAALPALRDAVGPDGTVIALSSRRRCWRRRVPRAGRRALTCSSSPTLARSPSPARRSCRIRRRAGPPPARSPASPARPGHPARRDLALFHPIGRAALAPGSSRTVSPTKSSPRPAAHRDRGHGLGAGRLRRRAGSASWRWPSASYRLRTSAPVTGPRYHPGRTPGSPSGRTRHPAGLPDRRTAEARRHRRTAACRCAVNGEIT